MEANGGTESWGGNVARAGVGGVREEPPAAPRPLLHRLVGWKKESFVKLTINLKI